MAFPPPIPLATAQARMLDMVTPLPAQSLPVEEAFGRYLAAPLVAGRTQPPADLSAMDGYAVPIGNGAEDLAGPWKMVGVSAAGHPFAGQLQAGEAIRISTGALMPEGGGEYGVLIQENAARDGDSLTHTDGEPAQRHIRRKGFDFGIGDPLMEAGTRIGAAQVALALSGGHARLEVCRLPSLAILDSGDELALDPANCARHQIPASNGAMLGAMTAGLGADLLRLGPVRDQMDAMMAALERAQHADIVVTSGGASVGDHDLVRPALEAWGAEIDFWRVAMKPGKPLLVARRGKQIILGLPGNPVSSFVAGFAFMLPLLRKLAGSLNPLPQEVSASLTGDLPPTRGRLEFVRAVYHNGEAAPIDERDSSALFALASSNAFIMRAPNSERANAGDTVVVYPIEGNGQG